MLLQESRSTNSSKGQKGQIDELLRCMICFSKVKNPQMCPSCSKLSCNHCIKKWLTEQKSQCPHCRCPLRTSQLVNCRFVSEIANVIDQMHTKREEDTELCHHHQVKLSYYCKTCETPICADCAMFGVEHKGHQFEHIAKVYESHVELVKNEAQSLKSRLKSLNNSLASIVSTIDHVTRAKEEKTAEIGLAIEQMNKKLESELKSKLVALLSQKGSITDEIEFLESLQGELNRQLLHSPKSALILKSIELVKMIREINAKPVPKYNKHSITPEFRSELVPEYDSAVFYLRPFSILRKNTEVVYSEPLHSNGLVWRLKVYPNGNGQAKNEYLSVFLEMVKGLQDMAKYEYKVEMINQRNPEVVTVREFASEFETGECWGYNKFCKLDQLEREGYVTPEDDMIVLKFFVRAPTYYQQCQDQQRYIQHLERIKAQSNTMISELKEKLNQETEKNRRLSEMNPSLLSTLKNSASPDRNEDIFLTKLSPHSGQEDESFSQKEEEVDLREELERSGQGNQIKDSEFGDLGEDGVLYEDEGMEENNLDLPTAQIHHNEKLIANDIRNVRNHEGSPSPPIQEENKYPDLFGTNFEADLDFCYEKLDAFLKRSKIDLADEDKGALKRPFSNNGPLQDDYEDDDDNSQLKSLHQSESDKSASLDDFCDTVHANMEAEEKLKPIDIDNIFNTKNYQSSNEQKGVTKNLLSDFTAELVPLNKEKSDKKTGRLDKNFLQLSDSLMKRLGGLRNTHSKERVIDRSIDGKNWLASASMIEKTQRGKDTEKENKI